MKKLLLAMLMGLTFAACSDSTSSDSDSPKFAAKVNGASWSAQGVTSSKSGNHVILGGTLDITASLDKLESMSITIDSVAAGRTIQLGGDSTFIPANNASYTKAGVTYEVPGSRPSGSVTITDISGGRIKGTFSFTAFKDGVVGNDSVVVTEGSYNATY